MPWMHSNMWVFFIPIMIIMKIEYTIVGKTSLLEFALFIKFITSHKRRQIGHIFTWHFFIIIRRTISSRSGSHRLPNTLYIPIVVDLFTDNCQFNIENNAENKKKKLDFFISLFLSFSANVKWTKECRILNQIFKPAIGTFSAERCHMYTYVLSIK